MQIFRRDLRERRHVKDEPLQRDILRTENNDGDSFHATLPQLFRDGRDDAVDVLCQQWMLASLYGTIVHAREGEVGTVVQVAVVADRVQADDEKIGVLFHEMVIGPICHDILGHAIQIPLSVSLSLRTSRIGVHFSLLISCEPNFATVPAISCLLTTTYNIQD